MYCDERLISYDEYYDRAYYDFKITVYVEREYVEYSLKGFSEGIINLQEILFER